MKKVDGRLENGFSGVLWETVGAGFKPARKGCDWHRVSGDHTRHATPGRAVPTRRESARGWLEEKSRGSVVHRWQQA